MASSSSRLCLAHGPRSQGAPSGVAGARGPWSEASDLTLSTKRHPPANLADSFATASAIPRATTKTPAGILVIIRS
jgi:hypothetical protein